ncbi:MAG TPA: 4-hydroxy-tetrahydrodipicolinate reductase [Sphaerochaeta sp.]|jgi:4-hydroxy-tetrahydrodipicolinate reductase|nr:4-hydroxy-tetrahydrodipicolinate reductase [Sphaerochaeta sp.]HQB54265.1 4-hydroxy-tetrahydrodipicolinate reductase [Sphaerochaeta sp.]
MKLALVGYGKMGKIIETHALAQEHTISSIIDPFVEGAKKSLTLEHLQGCDVAIDFTHPDVALEHIRFYIKNRIPAVIGTTGWYEHLGEVASMVDEANATILYSGNFSLGVALFLRSVRYAAALYGRTGRYDPAIIEVHHNKKADSPSGTASMLASTVLEGFPGKTRIEYETQHQRRSDEVLHVSSLRVGSVPGTHTVLFDSPEDTIELIHTARNRDGFAFGAVAAAAWLKEQKSGLYTLEDMVDAVFLR